MSDSLNAGREAVHVLVDMVSAYDFDNPDSWQGMVDTATPRLIEVGAITASVDDDDSDVGSVNLEVGPLVGGISVMLNRVAWELSGLTGMSRDDVILQMRQWIDADLS